MELVVLYDPVCAVDDGLDRSTELVALDHLHIDDIHVGGNAECRSGDRTGDGGAVRVADLGIVGKAGIADSYASFELGMRWRNAAIEYVNGHSLTSGRVPVCLIERHVALIDAIEREGNRR